MGTTTLYLMGLAAWVLIGLKMLPFGQILLIAGADGRSPLALSLGLLVIVSWLVGAWFGCYKLFGGGSSGKSRAGAAVKAVGGMVVVMLLTTSALRAIVPLLTPKPSSNVDFFWKRLDRTNSFAVATFIKQNPDSPHLQEAKQILTTLESSDWKRIQAEADPLRKASELDLYLKMDPQVYPWQHRQEAQELLDEVEWEQVLNTVAADQRDRARAYLMLHKDGKHSKEAVEMANR